MSLQSCPALCDPIDGSPPGSAVPGILQARTLEWVAISFSNAWKWKVKAKSLSRVRPSATPWTATYQAPPSMGFSRQEYWVTFKIRVSCCKNHVWIGLQKQSFWLLGKELWKPEEPQCLVGKFWTASGKFSAVHRRGEAEALMGVCHSWQHHPFRLSLALF